MTNKYYRVVEVNDDEGYVVEDKLTWKQAFATLMRTYSNMVYDYHKGNYRARELNCLIESYELNADDEEVNNEIRMMKVVK